MTVPYTFATATSSIPLSQLDSNFATAITLGNTAVYLGNTITSIGNLTLSNTTISSVANTFPNSYLSNSSVTIGTTSVSLGGTATSIAGLTLTSGAFNGTLGATTPSTAVVTSLTDSGLTAGRVNYNGTGGLLVDSANLTFDGTTLTANKVTSTNDASIHGLTVGLGGGSVATNTAFGYSALTSNTSGNRNTAIGYFSTIYNTTGVSNTALGISSLYTNTTGNNNVAIGDGAVTSNTTGSNNIGIGVSALQANTTASNNTAVGYQAAYSTTTGSPNVAIGYQALYSNTNGTNNTAVGASAMYLNVNGYYNVAIGLNALYGNTSGAQNVAIGLQALNSNTTANNNTAVGYQAGYGLTTGSNNTYLGFSATQSGVAVSNEIVVGASLTGKGSNTAFIGGTSGAYNGANSTLWSITSDIRIKKNITSLESGLNVITALRPVEFDYINNDKHDIGFIAQEYREVLPAQISEGEDGMLALNQNLVPYLVKAIQELKAEFDAYKATHP